jgi:hypothetical protein
LRAASLAVLMLLLVAAGCGGGDSQQATDPEVRHFSEVQAGDIVFEPDSSDHTRGVFRVETTEPMICAIVWGEDESFGRFNNSLSMNGTGVTRHDVLLPDIEPGREYRYVIQGTTADGTLYRSEVASFRIGEAGATTTQPTDRGPNLALDATIEDASSEFSSSFAAENAIDGDTATEWATSGDGDDGSLTIDLGGPQEIAGVEFITRSMADGSSITDTFTVTVDGGEALGPFPAGTVTDPRFAELVAAGRLLRFDVESSTGGNVGAVEVRVFAG